MTIFWIHAGLIVVTHALDLWTTIVGLRHGARELNPLCADWAHETRRMTVSKALGTAFIVLTYWWIYTASPDRFVPLMFLHHGYMYCIVVKNAWTVRSLKQNPMRYLYRRAADDTLTYVGRCDLEKGQQCGPIAGTILEERVTWEAA